VRIIFANDQPGRQINKPIAWTWGYSRQNGYTDVLKYLKYLTPNTFTICTSDTLHLERSDRGGWDGCVLQYARAYRVLVEKP